MVGQGVVVSEVSTYDQLLELVAGLERVVREQAEEIAELKQRLGADSSNSSGPPSADGPWSKKPAKRRSLRTSSGRKPGKQPGAASCSRGLVDNADETLEIPPGSLHVV